VKKGEIESLHFLSFLFNFFSLERWCEGVKKKDWREKKHA
jgi:hypothetical protein